jgi:anionic cell wall polymer biosynthesis LytR-Cps2A-Psr (LCP) family protein
MSKDPARLGLPVADRQVRMVGVVEGYRDVTMFRKAGLLTGGLLVGLLAAGAAVCVWLALEYHWFSSDVAKSRARLPATLQSSLAPSKNVLNQPQVTLVRYTSDTSTGGAVLFSTNPQTKVVSFLTIPPVSTLGGRELRTYSTSQLIDGLKQRAGITVRHVAIIDLTNVGALVDGLGGIRVNNPAAFSVPVSGGQTWSFANGPLKLDGPHAVAYLRRSILTGDALGQAGVTVLKGIVHRVLEPSSVGSLQTTGTALATSTATDLSDADVVGLVYLRLDGGTGMECGLPPREELTSSTGSATVQAFLGQSPGQTSAAGCRARPIASKVFLPPKSVVKLVQRFGWGAFLAAAGLMLALMLAVGSVLILRSRRPVVVGESGEGPAVVAVPVSQQRSEDVVSSPAMADTLTNGHVDQQRIEPPAPAPDAPGLPAERPQAAPAEALPAAEVVPASPAAEPGVVMPEAVPADVLTEYLPPPAPAEDVVSAAPTPDVVEPPASDRTRVRWSVPRVNDVAEPTAVEQSPPAEPPGKWRTYVASAPTRRAAARTPTGQRAAARTPVSGRPADVPRRPQEAPDRSKRGGRRVSRSQAARRWIYLHQDVMWAVGLGAVVALVAGAFAGLI